MIFENVPVAPNENYTFKNTLPVRLYKNGKIGPQVGFADLKVEGDILMGDVEIDENKVCDEVTFKLFITNGEILTVLIEPTEDVQKPPFISAN